jgi:hypothetical protein
MPQEETFSIGSEVNKVLCCIDTVHGFPDSTFHMGGYDSACSIQVVSWGFSAKGKVYISTAQFHDFYLQLQKGYNTLQGVSKFGSYENDFEVEVVFDSMGHVRVQGYYTKEYGNELKFGFDTDQTFLAGTLNDLSKIAAKYGDSYGVKKLRTT